MNLARSQLRQSESAAETAARCDAKGPSRIKGDTGLAMSLIFSYKPVPAG